MTSLRIAANIVDLVEDRVFPGEVEVEQGRIQAIRALATQQSTFLIPGFIDAHVHIESSMLTPGEFARAAVVHGTVATVSAPHEIANVLGVQGIEYMLEDAEKVPFKFYFGAPSCVPATTFESSGAIIGSEQVAALLDDPRIRYLSEVMNYPGVLAENPEVMSKIKAALERGKPIDGHSPGLRGADAKQYFSTGISTDHECVTLPEALDKLSCGAHILIREGSAARNFDELCPVIRQYPEQCMFCSDDKHPDDLVSGHIDELARRAIAAGFDGMDVLRCACRNPVKHYHLDVGLLQVGDAADFVEVDDLTRLRILKTYIDGELVAEQGQSLIASHSARVVNRFDRATISRPALVVEAESARLNAIRVHDDQLVTSREIVETSLVGGKAVSDVSRDLLKIVVLSRYGNEPPAVAFVRGFGLKKGAMASSVAHDSHNVIAVGVSDEDIVEAVNLIIQAKGGLAACHGDEKHLLPLPVAGLISVDACEQVAEKYTRIDRCVKQWGSQLNAPYTTLSFMALLVIPEIKISDKGLFDAVRFDFLPLFE